MELLLVRHGLPERVHNADGTPADPPLSATGYAQATAVAAWLVAEPIDALYTSPLRRARETAAPLASRTGLAPRVEEGVAEFDRHASFYVPMEELKLLDPARFAELMSGGWDFDPVTYQQEVVAAVERIICAHPGERVVVACHGGVINMWAAHVLGLGARMFFQPVYCSVSSFLASGSGARSVRSLNETGHLMPVR